MSGLEHDRGTRLQRISALSTDRKNLPALAAELKDPDPEVRLAVVEAIIFMDDPAAHPVLVRSLFDEDKRVKRRCGEALARRGADGLVQLFERMLASDRAWMREAAAMGMGQFASAALVPVLERVARGEDATLVKHARASLERQARKGNAAAAAAFGSLEGGAAAPAPTAAAAPAPTATVAPAPTATVAPAIAAGPVATPGAPLVDIVREARGASAGVRAPALPRSGGGRARDDSLGKVPLTELAVAAAAARDDHKFDLDADPGEIVIDAPPERAPAPEAAPGRPSAGQPRRLKPVRPAGVFADMPLGASGGTPPLRDCPVCGDPTPVNAYRCPNCKEQLRPDAPAPGGQRLTGRAIDDQIAGAHARGCASIVDSGYTMVFQLLTLGFFGGIAYVLFKDGLSGGASWGKDRYKCRVVDAHSGAPATMWQSFLRNLTLCLPFINFVEMVLVCTTGIRLGDRLANTRVIGGDPNANVFVMVLRLFFLAFLIIAGFSLFVIKLTGR